MFSASEREAPRVIVSVSVVLLWLKRKLYDTFEEVAL